MTPNEIRQQMTKRVLEHDYKRGPLLLLAGPGTGKTYSLVKTIQTQAQGLLQPNDFFEATLTNAAADKFLHDVKKKIPEFENSSTLHFRAKGILHKYAGRIGMGNNFVVFDKAELNVALTDTSLFLDDALQFEEELHRYQRIAAEGKTPDSPFAKVYAQLQLFYNAIDWFDVVNITIRLLEENDDIKNQVSSEFQFLLIDEYQDLNNADQRFVELLLNDRSFFLAVGDDDQSIYSGRFADPSGIVNFDKRYPNATKMMLPVSSRCPSQVIKAAHKLITNNQHRETKGELIPLPEVDNRANGGFAFSVNLKSDKAEVEFIGNALKTLIGTGVSPGQILILCLNKQMGKDLFEEIDRICPDLPVENIMEEEESDADQSLLNYLQAFLDKHSHNLSLRMILEGLTRNANLEIPTLVKRAIDERKTLWEVINDRRERQTETQTTKVVIEFTDVVDDSLEFDNIEEQLEYICEKDTFFKRLKPLLGKRGEEAKSGSAAQERIKFMTMHSSKGLEADFVFIPFMESHFSLPAKDLEEQRRLLYVAITRVKVGVVFSWAWSRRSGARFKAGGGPNTGRKPFGFISECGLNPSMFGWANSNPPPNTKALELLVMFGRHVVEWDKAKSHTAEEIA